MRTVTLHASIPSLGADEVFARICDFERYPEMTDAVRRVVVTPREDGSLESNWEVTFRSGILRWSENDEIDRKRRTIDFRQLDGDFERFAGRWAVDAEDAGCAVRFEAEFDLGMPTLAPMLDPIAESALRDNMGRILSGLVGRPTEFVPLAEPPVVDLTLAR